MISAALRGSCATRARTRATRKCCKRVMLSNAMLFLLRGVPVVYYGDEQGFVGHGIDQDSRQDMFASQVATYNDQALLGTAQHHGGGELQSRSIRCTRRSRRSRSCGSQHVALRRGRQVVRAHGKSRGCSPSRASAATAGRSWWHSIRRCEPCRGADRGRSRTRKCSRRCAVAAPPRQARRAASASKCRRSVMRCAKEWPSEVSSRAGAAAARRSAAHAQVVYSVAPDATVRSPDGKMIVTLRVNGRRAARIFDPAFRPRGHRLVAPRVHPRGCSPSSSAISSLARVEQKRDR